MAVDAVSNHQSVRWLPAAAASRRARAACAALASLVVAWDASAAALDIPVPYVPSTRVAVEEMLRLAEVGPRDFVVDLGSGDGRIVITAARYLGARGYGVDIDERLVEESNENARRAGVAGVVRFCRRDVLAADLSRATIVTLYLLPALIAKLKPKLLAELRPGARIVAHEFPIEGWQPDRAVTISKTIFLYVVPAQVAGRWRLEVTLPAGERSYEFELAQKLQEISGGARVSGGYLPFFEARLRGGRISFVIVEDDASHHFEGSVAGGTMEGTVRSGLGSAQVENRWRATRIDAPGKG